MMLPAEIAPWITLIKGLLQQPAAIPTHSLNSTRVEVELAAATAEKIDLAGFAGAGHALTLVVRSGNDYSAYFVGTSNGQFHLERETGSREAVATNNEAAREAAESARPLALANAIENSKITVSATLAGTSAETRFAWTADAILRAGGGGWLGPAIALSHAQEVVLIEAEGNFVRTESLVIGGVAAALAPTGDPPRPLGFGGVAEPSHYLPSETSGLDSVAALLVDVTVATAWMAIANDFESGSEGIPPRMILIGNRRVSVPLASGALPADSTEAADAMAMWRWVSRSDPEDRPSRLEALRQVAASLIETEADLRGAAQPVLSRARFVYEQSKKTAIEAVVNSRRAARESTRAAANSAAADARTAARSTSDRTVAAVLASLGVAIAHQTTSLDPTVAGLVLAAVVVGVLATAIHALCFEFPTASKTLQAVLDDLSRTHREVLLREDVEEILNGPVVRLSRKTINRARSTSIILLAVGLLSSIAAFVYLSESQDGRRTPTTSTTSNTAPSAAKDPVKIRASCNTDCGVQP